jgi:hypothetical protein
MPIGAFSSRCNARGIIYLVYLLIGGTVRGLTSTIEESKLYPSDLPWIHLQPFNNTPAPALLPRDLAPKYILPGKRKF